MQVERLENNSREKVERNMTNNNREKYETILVERSTSKRKLVERGQMLDQQNNPNVKDSDLSYISLVIISNLNCTVVCR